MWFGTFDGLNKYDGYGFTVYQFNPDDSLSISNNSVLSMVEDQFGSLWVGTYGGGLNKFDRKTEKFTRYQNQPDNPKSISSNNIWAIYKDSGGVLWVGTSDGLNKIVLSPDSIVNRSDRKTEKFIRYQHQPDNPQSLGRKSVWTIYEDTHGILWIGTDGELNKFDRKTEKFTRYGNQPDNPQSLSKNYSVRSILEDAEGNMWIGTWGGGLNKFDRKTEKFSRYQNQPDNPQSLNNNVVRALFDDFHGNIWIGTLGGGLNRFEKKSKTFTHYQNEAHHPHSLSGNSVLSIYEDAGGILWVGTLGGGLNKIDRKKNKFILYQNQADNPHSLSSNSVWSIYEDTMGYLWIGTYDGGLNKFDRKTNTFTHYQHQSYNPKSISDNMISSIIEDAGTNIWIGTYRGGLNKFDREKEKFISYQRVADNPYSLSTNSILSIYEDASQTLWIGTYNGLNKFNRKEERFIRYQHQPDNPHSLSHNSILTIYEDKGGVLWIGTWGGGLNKFNRKEESFISFQNQPDDPQSLSNNVILSIYEDDQGRFWIGTNGGGLNQFDRKTEKFTHYRKKDGLPNDIVQGIVGDDKGNLWLSTNKGISRFNPQTETFTNYDKADGLQSYEFNTGAFHRGKSGRMYFGGVNGFNEFYPDSIKDNTTIPPVVITDFLLFNKSVPAGETSVLKQNINFTDEIILNYTDYIFTIEFSALNYRQPEKNQFSYKLEGFNEDWIDTGYKNRRATFTNLSPGEYLFRVKASNDDGYWNEEGASLKIIVKPPFWKTWWFRSLCGLAMMLAVFAIYEIRAVNIKRRNKQLQALIYEKTKELQKEVAERKKTEVVLKEKTLLLAESNKELESFSYSVSHDLRSPLRAIEGFSTALLEDYLEKLDENGRRWLKTISQNTRKMSQLIDDLLRFSRLGRQELKLSRIDMNNLVKEVVADIRENPSRKRIQLICRDLPDTVGDSSLVRQVLINYLSNAVKFSRSCKKTIVEVGAQTAPKEIIYFVKDNGVGFDMKYADKLFAVFQRLHSAEEFEGTGIGLALVQRIIHRHGGRVWAEGEVGKGAIFYFCLPNQPRNEKT